MENNEKVPSSDCEEDEYEDFNLLTLSLLSLFLLLVNDNLGVINLKNHKKFSYYYGVSLSISDLLTYKCLQI